MTRHPSPLAAVAGARARRWRWPRRRPGRWTRRASRLTFSSSGQRRRPSPAASRAGTRRSTSTRRISPHSDVAATIDVTSAATGNGDRDAELPDQDWFWTSHFPRATFVAHGFQAGWAPAATSAAGVLTIRGVAKPLSLPFTLAINGAAAHMTGEVALNRLAFGVGQGEWAATDTVPADVTVNVDLTAHRAP